MSMVTGIRQPHASPNVWETEKERLERLKQAQQASGRKSEAVPQGGRPTARTDEYVHGEEPIPAGLYRMSKDEEGNPKILFDDPSHEDGKQAGVPEDMSAGQGASGPEGTSPDGKKAGSAPESAKGGKEAPESCTANTDRVDAEIRRLKEKKEELQQKLSRAADDPEEQKRLQAQLEQVERELSMKDNDGYRRQHTQFT